MEKEYYDSIRALFGRGIYRCGMHMRKRVKGSLTIEAAIIIPLAIFVVGVLMYSLFYYHDKIVLNAAASETAIYGSYVKEPREEELKEHMDSRIWGRLLLFAEAHHQIEIKKDEIQIISETKKGPMSLKVCGMARRTKPEQYIRTIQKIKKIGEKE